MNSYEDLIPDGDEFISSITMLVSITSAMYMQDKYEDDDLREIANGFRQMSLSQTSMFTDNPDDAVALAEINGEVILHVMRWIRDEKIEELKDTEWWESFQEAADFVGGMSMNDWESMSDELDLDDLKGE